MVKLDIFSDPICPWCHIGKARLDRALERRPDHPFKIEWHPFQLNPDMARSGMDRRAYLEAKFGGRDRAVEVYAAVQAEAEASGLKIDLAAIDRTPNTLDAHRLIHWAGIEGRQTAVVSALFRAYFAEGRDIGTAEVLCDIADSAGLDAAVIARLLSSEADRAEIVERDRQARQMGVTAVPTFIIDHRHAVPGAQPTDLWERAIDEILSQLADEGSKT